MSNPLFSNYRAGENRVTSSTLAVFERLDLTMVKELLQSASGMGEELVGVLFENQVSSRGSVPDGRISARFAWWFETKTNRFGYDTEGHDRDQVRAHTRLLEGDPDARLFVLTPDNREPDWFRTLDGVDEAVALQVIWLSFAGLATAVRELLSDHTRLIGEQTRFLLTELIALYEADGLLSTDDTVVVAARLAWGSYLQHSAYVCQPHRAFRSGLTHFAFYRQGQIMTSVARIESWTPSITLSAEEADTARRSGNERLATLIAGVLEAGEREPGRSYGVMLLSAHDAPETVTLKHPLENDTTTKNGRPGAWTQGQRYTSLDRLTAGFTRTSQL